MNPLNFTPTLFIGIGETNAFFTLRETYLATVPGPGPMGNAILNGVYQGTYEVRSYHLRNLSQDPDEAYAKALEASHASGLQLTTKRERLEDDMRDIRRATAEELAAREKAREEQAALWAAEREAEEREKREQVLAGRFAFGPYRDKEFAEAPRGYLTWLVDTLPDFEEGSLIQLTAQEVQRRCSDLLLPKPVRDLYVGEEKQRMTFDVTVIRRFTFARESFAGYGMENVHIVTMVDKATGACIVSKSSAFYPEEGDELKIKATVKSHDEYRGQAQTVVQRVAVL